MQQVTREEVSKHCTKDSCWVIIDKNVYWVYNYVLFNRYDLTSYLYKHPPGGQMIVNLAQKDQNAKRMLSIHSPKAKMLWESFLIGTLVD